MRFTAEQAHEAHMEGEPIMVSRSWAVRAIRSHAGEPLARFDREVGVRERYDAWTVLSWLGY